MLIAFWIAIFAVSLFVLVMASDWFIDAAKDIGTFFGLPEFVIGVIIVAIGTSLPELASSTAAVLAGNSDIVVANVLGSNITNITLVFGISAVAGKYFKIDHDLMKTDIPFLLASTAMVVIMIMDQQFTRGEAILCTGGMAVYIWRGLKSGEFTEEVAAEKPAKLGFKPWLLLLASPALIALGANYTVKSVVTVSGLLGIGTEVIAVTAVALGTSLPEVLVSIQAARKGHPEMAVGNVIGSNIFNALAVMGIPGLVAPLMIPASIISFIVPMTIAATALLIIIMMDKRVFRFEGFILLFLYIYFLGHNYGGF